MCVTFKKCSNTNFKQWINELSFDRIKWYEKYEIKIINSVIGNTMYSLFWVSLPVCSHVFNI